MILVLALILGLEAPGCLECLSLQQPWFYAEREIELTGDTRMDTVRIWADGPSSDSLTVTVAFIVDGRERWRRQWKSNYMLIDPPEFPAGEADRAEYIRQALVRTLAGVSVHGFDPTSYEIMAATVDSTVVQHPPSDEIVLSYGYETTLVLMWDTTAATFRLLWSCC